jgi:hypothetical protein
MKNLLITLLLITSLTGYSQDTTRLTTGKLFGVTKWDSTRVLLPLDTTRLDDEEYMFGRVFDSLTIAHEVKIDLIIEKPDGDEIHRFIEFKNDWGSTITLWIDTKKRKPTNK